MNETGINVKEIAEQANESSSPYIGACQADLMASIRVHDLAEAIIKYVESSEKTVGDTERCMVYAEEMLDQLAIMKKYGQQDAQWLARGLK